MITTRHIFFHIENNIPDVYVTCDIVYLGGMNAFEIGNKMNSVQSLTRESISLHLKDLP